MRIAVALALLTIFSSVSQAQPINAEEFVPPVGRQPGAGAEAPGVFRLLLATSADGLNFTRLERVVSDQANTPNMIVTSTGRILLYYTGAAINGARDGIAVAVSDDHAASWRYFRVRFAGFPAGLPPLGDPDVVLNADGTWTMYVTGAVGNLPGIYYATSTDGFTFTYGGIALSDSAPLIDSLTHRIGSASYMYVLRATGDLTVLATSTDGRRFTVASSRTMAISGRNYFLSNWTPLDGGSYRIYGFSLTAGDIRSFVTADGISLTADSGQRLIYGGSALEADQIKDPAVARLRDGRYLMAYVSRIPQVTSAPGAPQALSAAVSGTTVSLTWAAPAFGGAPSTYVIEAGSATGIANLAAFPTGTTQTAFAAGGVPPGQYFVRVRAANSVGVGAASNEVVLMAGSRACAAAPLSPATLQHTVRGGIVTLSWSASPGGEAPMHYELEAGSAPALANLAVFTTAAPSLTAAAPPGIYYVRVRAVNACGRSAPGNEITVAVTR